MCELKTVEECEAIESDLWKISRDTFKRCLEGKKLEVIAEDSVTYLVYTGYFNFYIPKSFTQEISYTVKLEDIRHSLNRYTDFLSDSIATGNNRMTKLELANLLDRANCVVFDIEKLIKIEEE